jgi:hypothetical protein
MSSANKSTMNLYPIKQCIRRANTLLPLGAIIHQQFNCGACGTKQTMETPDVFFKSGTCEICHAVTNIEATGCNYLVELHNVDRAKLAAFEKALNDEGN